MNTTTFNPSAHIIQLKGQDYLPVQWRLVWFRERHPHGVITTTMAHLDLETQIAVFHARVEDGEGGIGEGYGSESAKDFRDYIEKASTKAIGRALASLGYGTQFAPDLDEGSERLADAPVQRSRPAPAKEPKELQGAILQSQVEALASMYGKLNKQMPDVSSWSAQKAAEAIKQLQAEWRQFNQKAS